jgi:hypothetical protein
MNKRGTHFIFKPIENSDLYDVELWGTHLGTIEYNERAWAGERWFIIGEKVDYRYGGVNHATKKPCGYANRTLAALELARYKSAHLLKVV